MAVGISARNYEEMIEKLLHGYGIKKSSISRHFIQATAEQMREFLERSLLGLNFCVVFIDGITWILIGKITDNPGSSDWVPTVASPKTKCKVKIELIDASGNVLGQDTSDSTFTIQP